MTTSSAPPSIQELKRTLVAVHAIQNSAERERLLAILSGHETDPSLLAKVASNDRITQNRVRAVKKLTDQAVLAKFAVEDGNADVRAVAVGRLNETTVRASRRTDWRRLATTGGV